MGIFDSLINPASVGGAFAQGMEHGKEQREEREVKGALSAYAVNPDDPKAFETLAQYKPELAISIRQDQQKRQQAAHAADLQRRAASGDKAAHAELAGIDLDAWDKLADNQRQAIKGQVDYIGNAALSISRLPAEQRPAAWDQYIEQGVRQGYSDLAQYRGQYSDEALNGAIANAGKVQQFIDLHDPKYQAVPEGGTLVNVNDPNAVRSFSAGAAAPSGNLTQPASKADFDALPAGAEYRAPDGTVRRKGGQTATPSATFRGGFRGLPGETVTSTYRDPAHNKRVGGVDNSFHMRRWPDGTPKARDSVPPPGMSMAAYHRKLKAENPDMDVINEGDHVHMEPKG